MSEKNIVTALRKNKGRRLIKNWSVELSKALDMEINKDHFLSIEETARLKNEFFSELKKNKSVYRINLNTDSTSILSNKLERVGSKLGSMQVVLLSNIDEFVGAIIVPAQAILKNPISIWKFVGNDLCLFTQDIFNGLCLEINDYDIDGKYRKGGIYELSCWGIFTEYILESKGGL